MSFGRKRLNSRSYLTPLSRLRNTLPPTWCSCSLTTVFSLSQ